ncbi:MAG TPA: hypothetical protein VJ837_05225, partial [Candidatus Paceibacterota bacterium]|nr:hypothetical protein [Candidatus Paceibacterota bacterium]
MLAVHKLSVSGLNWDGNLLWLAIPEKHLVACYDPATGESEEKLRYEHAVWDVCGSEEGLWMMTEGGRLGRQLVLWSFGEEKEIRKFNCPDGAAAGITIYLDRLWLTHRNNRKLFCLDPANGKLIWMMRTERESFSPAACGNELWFIEADLGPLGHWSASGQGKYFFARYAPVRETIVERRPVSFHPACMALDGERF